MIFELLPADAGFIHQTAIRHGEDHDTFFILGTPGGAGGDGHGAGLGAEFEVALCKTVQRRLVLEEDEFGIALAAGLESDRNLSQDGFALGLVAALLIELAGATGRSNPERAFGDRWEST